MKKLLTICLLFFSMFLVAQKDSLQLGEPYWEDQLYFSVSYNILDKQPKGAESNAFSYGLSLGYIKDIPFNRKGNWAAGIGIGYNYDSFNHRLQVDEKGNLTLNSAINSSKIKLHNLELPIQLRWRTSNAVTYSFWRVYAGIRLSYNLNNNFSYTLNNQYYNYNNINSYNNFQTGLEFSAGYSAFNFYIYYGLTPIYKKITINEVPVNTQIIKLGLVFYLL